MAADKDYVVDLMEKYGDMVMKISFTYMKNKDDAEDVTQDVFLKIIEKMPQFNDLEHEKAWVIRITVNTCKNKLKAFWNNNVGAMDNVPESSTTDRYKSQETDVIGAVMKLPEKYRIVIYMYYYEGYTTPEIAEILDLGEVNVRSLLHRGRGKLKSMLKEEYDFE